MYLLEPTDEAKATARKRVTAVEYEDGGVSIRYRGVTLAARPFHRDGCVTQASIFENKLLSGALTEIRKRQQQREQDLVRSAKSKREKRIVRDRFADRLPLREPETAALRDAYLRRLKSSASCPTPTFPQTHQRVRPAQAALKRCSQPASTYPLPDISILESYPTRGFGFDRALSLSPAG